MMLTMSLQLYNRELEAEFGPFDDWVNTYELFRGKASEEEGATEERFVGKFKVRRLARMSLPLRMSKHTDDLSSH